MFKSPIWTTDWTTFRSCAVSVISVPQIIWFDAIKATLFDVGNFVVLALALGVNVTSEMTFFKFRAFKFSLPEHTA